MFGKGLIKGLKITFKRFFQKKVTLKYPEVKPALPARSHGTFDYCAENCIPCNLCAEACPNRVIKVDFHKNEKGKRVLANYKMNLNYCMFCGLCTEACPTKTLKTKPDFELADFSKESAVLNWEGNIEKNEIDPSKVAAEEVASVQEVG